jgi:hypothetical protein
MSDWIVPVTFVINAAIIFLVGVVLIITGCLHHWNIMINFGISLVFIEALFFIAIGIVMDEKENW